MPFHTAYHSTASIGATLFRNHQTEIEVLLKQADLAMYKSKEAGRNTLRFFDPEMEIAVTQRAALEKNLRAALDTDPEMANAHLALVNLYLQEKRDADAIQELQAFLRQSPESEFAPHARQLLKKLQPDTTAQ